MTGRTPADRAERFAAGRWATLVMVAWGFAEAIVLPIVPDVLLFPLGAAAPRRAAWLFGCVIAGALAGSALLYGVAVSGPTTAQDLVLSVPGIDRPMLDAAIAEVGGGDPSSMAQWGPGTPLKVYTVGWATAGGSFLGVLLGVVVNRLSRIGPGLLASALAGALAPGWLRRHQWSVFLAYAAAWTVYYVARFAGLVPVD